MVVDERDCTARPHAHKARRPALQGDWGFDAAAAAALGKTAVHRTRGGGERTERRGWVQHTQTSNTQHHPCLRIHQAPQLAAAKRLLQDALGCKVKGCVGATRLVNPVDSALAMAILVVVEHTIRVLACVPVLTKRHLWHLQGQQNKMTISATANEDEVNANNVHIHMCVCVVLVVVVGGGSV